MMNNISVLELQFSNCIGIDTQLRVYHALCFPMSLFIGSVFYCFTIHYERYGGDPMKRSIQNKLVSAIAFSALILCYTSNIALAWRIQIGPINDKIAITINCVHQSVVMFGSMNLSEIMIYKVKDTFTKDLRI